jgi:hypothetical protein
MGNEQKVNPEKQEKTGRDESGKFIAGVSGNPAGRPKGLSITEMVREALKTCPPDSRETYGDLFVKRILHKAIKEGDQTLMKAVWAYMDGQPKQSTDITTNGESINNTDELKDLLAEVKSLHDTK